MCWCRIVDRVFQRLWRPETLVWYSFRRMLVGLWRRVLHHSRIFVAWYDIENNVQFVLQNLFLLFLWCFLTGFFIAVEFFFTITFILTLVAGLLTLAYLCTSRDAENFVCLLAILGGSMFSAGKHTEHWTILILLRI